MNNCFIILAAGESKRFNSKIPKQYYLYNGKPVIQHSIDKASLCKNINKIIIVINKKHKKFIKTLKLIIKTTIFMKLPINFIISYGIVFVIGTSNFPKIY